MKMKRLLLIAVLGLFTIGWGVSAWAVSKTIALPITLDYPLIRSVLRDRLNVKNGQMDRLQMCLGGKES